MKSEELTMFNLVGIHLSGDSWKTIGKALEQSKSIKEVAFNRCFLNDRVLDRITPYLKNNTSIQTLDLQANNLEDDQVVRILQTQTEKRDNVIWSYGLRGEFPEDID